MNDIKNAVSRYIDSQRDKMTEDLRTLVKIPSVIGETKLGMPFGEEPAKVLSAALNICRNAGLFIRNFDNYVGTVDLDWGAEPALGILCHLDIVPAGSGWTYPPFDITEDAGRLYGRGTIDNKGPAIAALYALKAIQALNIRLSENVRLIFGTNEENGSCDLAYYRSKEELPPMLFTPDCSYPVINTEKGVLRLGIDGNVSVPSSGMIIHKIEGGNAVNAVPDFCGALVSGVSPEEIMNCAAKLGSDISAEVHPSYNLQRIIIKGRGAHASLPENGSNAVTAMLKLLSSLSGGYAEIKALSRLYPFGETDGYSLDISCADDISGGLTAVLSMIEFDGFRIEAKSDVRFPVCRTSEEIINTLYLLCGDNNLRLSVHYSSEPHHVPESSEFIRTLLSVYEDFTGKSGYCISTGGSSYVHNTENGVAFGAEFPGYENNAHGPDESISVENLLLNAKIFANTIIRICGKEQD